MVKHRYKYLGPVLEFNALLMTNWEAETIAVSEEKARSQLKYQFKARHNRLPHARITLPGTLLELEQIME